jgi:sodium transport system permease protein
MMNRIPSVWHSIKVIFKKETKDGLRDWRAILMALMLPVMGPLMIIWMFSFIADVSTEPDRITIPVAGSDNAPGLISWLEQNGTTVKKAPKNPRTRVRDSSIKMALVIPDEYSKKIADGKPVTIELITNSEDPSLAPAVSKMTRLINTYGAQMGELRLLARGVNPEVAKPIVVKEVDASEGNAFKADLLLIVPLFVIMTAFFGSMMLAAELTTGERERGSIESLLLNPTSRPAIVLGKYFAAVAFSMAGLILTLAGCAGVLGYLPVEELGISIAFDRYTLMGLIATVLPLVFMVSALMLFISSLARSLKESQAVMSFVFIIPMIPVFMKNTGPVRTWMYAMPSFSQQRLITDLLGGESPALIHYILSGSASLLFVFVAVWLTTRQFHKESFIFGR